MIGNVTEDRLPGGGTVPGGPSLYSAHMARRLGARVTLVTALPETYGRDALGGLALVLAPAPSACTYANIYAPDGARTQLLIDPGTPLPAGIAEQCGPADALLAAPAYHELDRIPGLAAPVTAAALQGVLRTCDAEGRVSPHPDALGQARAFLRPGTFAFLSDEDTPEADALARAGAEAGATVFVTRAGSGATVYSRAGTWDIPAMPAHPVDPTGAGDCFAATFVVRYAETRDCTEALRWALAAGALATEGTGIQGIPSREAIELRARQEAD